ncbi:MAG: SAP domain-containing protein [Bdellovibrionales bacterium]
MSIWEKILTAFSGRKTSKRPAHRAHAGFSRAELALLSQFAKPRPLKPSGVNGAWEAVLQRSPHATLSWFIKKGLLEKAPVETQASRFTVKELKQHLKDRGLPVSGAKAELIKRLLSVCPDISRLLPNEPLWECTATAMPLVTEFTNKEESIKTTAMDAAKKALEAGDMLTAASIAAAYDAQRLFSSVHPDLFPPLNSTDVYQKLSLYVSASIKRPGAFSDVPDEQYRHALNEAMWSCLGFGRSTKLDHEIERIVLNLGCWSTSKRELERYRKLEAEGIIVGIEILCGDDGCAASSQHKGKLYDVHEAPELPMPGCTRLPCCACCYTAKVKDFDD